MNKLYIYEKFEESRKWKAEESNDVWDLMGSLTKFFQWIKFTFETTNAAGPMCFKF